MKCIIRYSVLEKKSYSIIQNLILKNKVLYVSGRDKRGVDRSVGSNHVINLVINYNEVSY